MRKNKKRLLALLLCISTFFTIKFSYEKYISMHPEKVYDIDDQDTIISMLDSDDFENSYYIPDMGSFVPQGVAVSDECIFLSLYDSYRDKNSCIYVFDMEFNLLNKCSLDNYSHVGGISVDDNNKTLWVSGTHGSVLVYSLDDVCGQDCASSIYSNELVGRDLINYKGQKAVSYLAVNGNKLYVGNYTCMNDGKLKEYEILDDGSLKFLKVYGAPTMVQGVSFYTYGEKEYIVFSRSCGESVNSFIQMYEFDDEFDYKKRAAINFEQDPMLEQICIDRNGNLMNVFENNASPYSGKGKKSDFRVFNLNKHIKNEQ